MSEGRPWRRAVAWLAFLGPFFFASYGLANWLASRRDGVGAIAYPWEQWIPFLPWTIVPYWSIDLLYVVSIFICATRRELDRHAQRLLLVQLVSIAFFIAVPLRFSFDRPTADGIFGALFAALGSFDKPFNQAPSLHIGLLVVIWTRLAAHVPRQPALRIALHAWMALIGISVLTTYQHHFIDIPTGLLVGFFAQWALPDGCESPLRRLALTRDARRRRLAARYAAGAIAFGAWINSRLWTRHHPLPAEVIDGVSIGRVPCGGSSGFAAIVDLSAELPCARSASYRNIPILDLTTPSAAVLREAVMAIEEAPRPVLACCALGYSRSAAAVVAWLLETHRAATVDEAMTMVRKVRPSIVLDREVFA